MNLVKRAGLFLVVLSVCVSVFFACPPVESNGIPEKHTIKKVTIKGNFPLNTGYVPFIAFRIKEGNGYLMSTPVPLYTSVDLLYGTLNSGWVNDTKYYKINVSSKITGNVLAFEKAQGLSPWASTWVDTFTVEVYDYFVFGQPNSLANILKDRTALGKEPIYVSLSFRYADNLDENGNLTIDLGNILFPNAAAGSQFQWDFTNDSANYSASSCSFYADYVSATVAPGSFSLPLNITSIKFNTVVNTIEDGVIKVRQYYLGNDGAESTTNYAGANLGLNTLHANLTPFSGANRRFFTTGFISP